MHGDCVYKEGKKARHQHLRWRCKLKEQTRTAFVANYHNEVARCNLFELAAMRGSVSGTETNTRAHSLDTRLQGNVCGDGVISLKTFGNRTDAKHAIVSIFLATRTACESIVGEGSYNGNKIAPYGVGAS